MCNKLEADANGKIVGYRMRCAQSKLTTVKALQSCGFETIAAGDSFNGLGMIRASKAGFLFRSTDKIKAGNPTFTAIGNLECSDMKKITQGVAQGHRTNACGGLSALLSAYGLLMMPISP